MKDTTQRPSADERGGRRRARPPRLPQGALPQLHSTNPLERLNGEIKRRTDVVAIFPNEGAIVRLVGALLLEQNDEWAASRARYMSLEKLAQFSVSARAFAQSRCDALWLGLWIIGYLCVRAGQLRGWCRRSGTAVPTR
jgi:Transposase, Mutator family